MAKEDKELPRPIVHAGDIQNYYRNHIETCRRMMRKARKVLGKKPRSPLHVDEFCEVNDIRVDKFREHMLMPLLYMCVFFGVAYLFRDDMDLYWRWFIAFLMLRFKYPWFNRFWNKARYFLIHPLSVINRNS